MSEEGSTEVSAEQSVSDAVSEQEPSFYYAEGIAGTGDKPEYLKDKYQTVEAQARAYGDLEGRFGAFTGAPDDYQVLLSQEQADAGMELDAEDPFISSMLEFAKESNMNQAGVDGLINLHLMNEATRSDELKTFQAEQVAALGENGQGRIDNLEKWGNANLPSDMVDGFKDLVHSAESAKAVEHLISLGRKAPMSPAGVTPVSNVNAEEVRAMQFATDDNGNRKIQTDPDFKARYIELRNQVHGLEDYRQVIG